MGDGIPHVTTKGLTIFFRTASTYKCFYGTNLYCSKVGYATYGILSHAAICLARILRHIVVCCAAQEAGAPKRFSIIPTPTELKQQNLQNKG